MGLTATGHIQGAVHILLVGFVLHGCPVMIQRLVRFRITSRMNISTNVLNR